MRNPVNRVTGILGLIMIGAISYQVATGELQLQDAAIRAGATLLAVIVVRRIGRLGMSMLASSMERQAVRAAPRNDELS